MSNLKMTKDLGAAAYLRTLGIHVEIKRVDDRGEFYYEDVFQKDVNTYYANENKFLSFANNIRNMKAQISSLVEGG